MTGTIFTVLSHIPKSVGMGQINFGRNLLSLYATTNQQSTEIVAPQVTGHYTTNSGIKVEYEMEVLSAKGSTTQVQMEIDSIVNSLDDYKGKHATAKSH
jgi:hypothetical protein